MHARAWGENRGARSARADVKPHTGRRYARYAVMASRAARLRRRLAVDDAGNVCRGAATAETCGARDVIVSRFQGRRRRPPGHGWLPDRTSRHRPDGLHAITDRSKDVTARRRMVADRPGKHAGGHPAGRWPLHRAPTRVDAGHCCGVKKPGAKSRATNCGIIRSMIAKGGPRTRGLRDATSRCHRQDEKNKLRYQFKDKG